MNKLKWSRLRLLAAGMACSGLLLAACNDQNTSGRGTVVKKKDSAARSNAAATDPGLTLPVLDALFYEDGFAEELKSKLQLTDEQVRQLKTTAHESVSELTEDYAGDYSGSAREAAKRSREKINAVIGDEKAAQLFQLVAQRYAAGDVAGLWPTKPNSIPTDTRIVVNAPAYRLDIFQQGKLLKSYRVGIGYPEFPLPTGMRRAEQIIFNPTWTPPDEPWVKGKVQAGQKVAAGSKLNPLGPIKIPIGLPSLIHGGKAVAKLGTFASHGCVGMTNAQVQDFTGMLAQLSGLPISPDSVRSFEQQKTKTKAVPLNNPIPVELRYETIVAENGGLHIYRDVYERGTNTVENAGNVLAAYGIKYESLNGQEKAALTQALAQMDRDPRGNPVTGTAQGSDSTADAGDEKEKTDNKDRAKKGKVTSKIVGQKEIFVPIAALQGKGYPAPVSLDTGAVQTAVPATARR